MVAFRNAYGVTLLIIRIHCISLRGERIEHGSEGYYVTYPREGRFGTGSGGLLRNRFSLSQAATI